MREVFSNRLDGAKENEEQRSGVFIEGDKLFCIKVKLINGSLRSRRQIEITKGQAREMAKRYYIEKLVEYSERGLLLAPEYQLKLDKIYKKLSAIEEVNT